MLKKSFYRSLLKKCHKYSLSQQFKNRYRYLHSPMVCWTAIFSVCGYKKCTFYRKPEIHFYPKGNRNSLKEDSPFPDVILTEKNQEYYYRISVNKSSYNCQHTLSNEKHDLYSLFRYLCDPYVNDSGLKQWGVTVSRQHFSLVGQYWLGGEGFLLCTQGFICGIFNMIKPIFFYVYL